MLLAKTVCSFPYVHSFGEHDEESILNFELALSVKDFFWKKMISAQVLT
jgi:hypothetical protein